MRKSVDYLYFTASKINFLASVLMNKDIEISGRVAEGLAKILFEITDEVERVKDRISVLSKKFP